MKVMVVLLKRLMIVVVMVTITAHVLPEINWHIYYDTSALEIVFLANCPGEVWSGAICALHYS